MTLRSLSALMIFLFGGPIAGKNHATRAKQPDIPTRPAAIIRLAEAGLARG
jgi:hypothetical protein